MYVLTSLSRLKPLVKQELPTILESTLDKATSEAGTTYPFGVHPR